MDVNAMVSIGAGETSDAAWSELAAESVMRTSFEPAAPREAFYGEGFDDLERVLALTEIKTIWHPARI
jgi:hypothetical protein